MQDIAVLGGNPTDGNQVAAHRWVMISANAATHLVRLGFIAGLARILTPEDFGIVAIVAAIVGIGHVVRDLGLSTATAQRNVVSHEILSNLFWINVTVGCALALACYFAAPWLAKWFSQPELLGVTQVLAVSFVFTGLANQHRALLRRQLRFGRLAVLSLSAVLAGFSVALAVAISGAGYWALVAATLTIDVSALLLAWSLCRWRPRSPTIASGTGQLLSYGGHVLAFNVMAYAAQAAQPLAIGRIWSAGDVGIYSRAHALMYLPVNHLLLPMSLVMIPVLARLTQDAVSFREEFLRSVHVLVGLSVAIGTFSWVFAPEIIFTLYGEQWGRSVEVFRWLAISVVLFPLIGCCAWILQARGRMGVLTAWGATSQGLMVVIAVLAAPFGLKAVAASHSLGTFILVAPAVVIAVQGTGVRAKHVLMLPGKPLAAATISAVAAWVAIEALGIVAAWQRLVAGVAAFGAAYAFILDRLFHDRLFQDVLRAIHRAK